MEHNTTSFDIAAQYNEEVAAHYAHIDFMNEVYLQEQASMNNTFAEEYAYAGGF